MHGGQHCGTVNILLPKFLLESATLHPVTVRSSICDDGKIQAKDKEAFNSCRFQEYPSRGGGGVGEVCSLLLFKVFLIRSSDEDTG